MWYGSKGYCTDRLRYHKYAIPLFDDCEDQNLVYPSHCHKKSSRSLSTPLTLYDNMVSLVVHLVARPYHMVPFQSLIRFYDSQHRGIRSIEIESTI